MCYSLVQPTESLHYCLVGSRIADPSNICRPNCLGDLRLAPSLRDILHHRQYQAEGRGGSSGNSASVSASIALVSSPSAKDQSRRSEGSLTSAPPTSRSTLGPGSFPSSRASHGCRPGSRKMNEIAVRFQARLSYRDPFPRSRHKLHATLSKENLHLGKPAILPST